MKKKYMLLSAALIVLMMPACQNLEESMNGSGETPEIETNEGFALYANLPVTRTTLLGDYSLEWNQSDRLAVFNAPAGTSEFSENLQFKIDEEATGKFSPADGVTVPFEDGVNYDWYVCCPYRYTNGATELKTPLGQSSEDGYFPIGATTQTGYNSSVHVSSFDIMVGKATDTRTPNITLKHLAVLHKFTVTNNSDKPTVITKLTFNGGENKIFGTFRIDLTSDEPALDVNNANNTYNERALTVTDGTELAVGESADFYMVTAPFTLNTGETFSVKIETTTGTQTVSKTAPSDIEFAAGTFNTAGLVYDYVPEHLYYDTFYDSSSDLTSNTTFNEGSISARWKSYLADLSGLSVYDGVKSNISYEYVWCQPSCQTATALVGMDGMHLWFSASYDASLTVSGIKLYGYTALNLSFVQTYRRSGLKVEYSVDEGTTWTEIGTTALTNSAYAHNASFDFEVAEGSETISIRFTKTAEAPRIDNIKLTWQE